MLQQRIRLIRAAEPARAMVVGTFAVQFIPKVESSASFPQRPTR